LLVLLRAVGLW